jgi:hypothetical protein
VSVKSWIVVELVVHPAWTIDERDPELAQSWNRLRAALAEPPHQEINASSSGRQALLFAISTDLDAVLQVARRHAPTQGIASFVARVWSDDPRSSDEAPRVIELAAPHAPWPKPGYGSDLAAVLAALSPTGRSSVFAPYARPHHRI